MFIFHFLHWSWKPPESLGGKKMWYIMLDVKQGTVQQYRLKQFLDTHLPFLYTLPTNYLIM